MHNIRSPSKPSKCWRYKNLSFFSVSSFVFLLGKETQVVMQCFVVKEKERVGLESLLNLPPTVGLELFWGGGLVGLFAVFAGESEVSLND